ncbi:MAG: hypothetical protein GX146_07070 [Myxococcales bacterium]|nr:hypothetical protein [Myxococcales bacterium]
MNDERSPDSKSRPSRAPRPKNAERAPRSRNARGRSADDPRRDAPNAQGRTSQAPPPGRAPRTHGTAESSGKRRPQSTGEKRERPEGKSARPQDGQRGRDRRGGRRGGRSDRPDRSDRSERGDNRSERRPRSAGHDAQRSYEAPSDNSRQQPMAAEAPESTAFLRDRQRALSGGRDRPKLLEPEEAPVIFEGSADGADFLSMSPDQVTYLKVHDAQYMDFLPDLPDYAFDDTGELMDVCGVKLYYADPVEHCDSENIALQVGEEVIVETDRGLALGRVMVATARRWIKTKKLPRIIRRATVNDFRHRDRNRQRELDALSLCQSQITAMRLPMKLIDVDFLHGGNKAIFYFSAEGRVDFRDIVRELARKLHVRVEMRQVGIRDAARMMGGIGTCGQQLCCNRYIREFAQVSIRMAKDQDLVLNPEKVSGACGRLMCCLAYEEQGYREASKGMPKVGKRVMTPDGEGRVRDRDVLKRRARVQLAATSEYREYTVDELSPPPDLPRGGERGSGGRGEGRQPRKPERSNGPPE